MLLALLVLGVLVGVYWMGYERGKEKARGEHNPPPAGRAKVRLLSSHPAVQAPRPISTTRSSTIVPREGTVKVRPQPTSLWESRMWRVRGNSLVGYYRTPWGAFRGKINNYRGNNPSFYIHDPPEGLHDHPHAPCFQPRGNGRFFVHFSPKPRDPDSGIRKIEQILHEVLNS